MFRGEIWLVRLDPTEGSEIAKTRPTLIVSNNAIGILPLKVIVPITDWKERYIDRPWMVKLSPNPETGLIKESVADTFQVRSISHSRFIQKLGKVSDLEMQQVNHSLFIVLKD
jgi:mRNA interferase MazF